MKIHLIPFKGVPNNYSRIDQTLSRSAQPELEDFEWLKQQGVTDVVNFRTMVVSGLNFDEKSTVESLGMNYYNIASVTNQPEEENIIKFLDLTEKIKSKKGKLHIHCKAGADRTGMYAFVYKVINNLGSIAENEKEWIARGHDLVRYPNLRNWTKSFIEKFKPVL